jgi:MFS transporter, DHA3 family, macrolide efflux protein
MDRMKKILYLFFILQGFSVIGSRITAVGVGIWLVAETGQVTPLLLISLFNELPLLVFGTWIGLAADRWKRKTAIIIGDTGQAVCVILLVVSLNSGYFELWHIYLIIAFQGLCMALQGSATSALLPMMVKDEELDRANAMRELLFPLASVIAPFLAGMMYVGIGLNGILVIDILTFCICTGVMLFLPLPEINKEITHREKENVWVEAMKGYLFLWKNKPLLYLVLYFAWWNFILNGPLELAVPYFLFITGSETVMSYLLAMMNAGALLGAIAALWWGHFNHKILIIITGSLLTSSMFVVVGLSQHVWVMSVALFLLMLPLAMTGALFSSLLQRKTPLSLQGRVFTAFGQLSAIAAPLSFFVTGPMVDQWLEPAMTGKRWRLANDIFGSHQGSGISLLFVVCGILLLSGAVWTLCSPKVRHIEKDLADSMSNNDV